MGAEKTERKEEAEAHAEEEFRGAMRGETTWWSGIRRGSGVEGGREPRGNVEFMAAIQHANKADTADFRR